MQQRSLLADLSATKVCPLQQEEGKRMEGGGRVGRRVKEDTQHSPVTNDFIDVHIALSA